MKILLMSNKQYALFNNKGQVLGLYSNLKLLLTVLKEFKIQKNEIEKALNAMIDLKHNAIEFGINNTFIFSKLIETLDEQQKWVGFKQPLRDHVDWKRKPTNKYSLKEKDTIWN